MTRKVLVSVLMAGTLAFGAAALAQNTTKDQPKKDAHTTKVDKDHGHDHAAEPKKAKVGEKAPDFTLTDLDGKKWTLSELTKQRKVVVLEWFNPDCPYSGVKHYKNHQTMNETANAYKDRGVIWLTINSGTDQAGGSKERNEQARKDWSIKHPILLDEGAKVAQTYTSKNTPTMYIIGADGTLVYWGAIDNDKSADTVGTVNYVAKALDQVLAGETVTDAQTKPYGCSVKYPKNDSDSKDTEKKNRK